MEGTQNIEAELGNVTLKEHIFMYNWTDISDVKSILEGTEKQNKWRAIDLWQFHGCRGRNTTFWGNALVNVPQKKITYIMIWHTVELISVLSRMSL